MTITTTEIEHVESSLEDLNNIEIIDLESILVKEFEQELPSDINFCA